MAQLTTTVDDENKTAKDLWNEIDFIYRVSNTQAVINLQRKLESLSKNEAEDFDKHLTYFHTIINMLGAAGTAVTDSERTSKLLRKLPESFSPLYMIAESTNLAFDKVIDSVERVISM